MDASAFSVTGPDGDEMAVLVVQCNTNDSTQNLPLTRRLHREIHEDLGINCLIELVPRHTLPRTSSGKLSRSAARLDYLHRREQEKKGVEPITVKAPLGGKPVAPLPSVWPATDSSVTVMAAPRVPVSIG